MDRRKALDALGAYQKRGRVSDNLSEIIEMLMNESDRGVVVILGSLLEDALLDRIEQAFQPLTSRQKKNLVRAGGLLSNFDDRINLAHALGLIDLDLVENLQLIKAMRNACAHSRLDLTFLTTELRGVIALLFAEETADIIRTTDQALAIRIFFIAMYIIILHQIKGMTGDSAFILGQRMVDIVNDHLRDELQRQQSSPEK